MKYLTDNEIVFNTAETAFKVAQELVEENYVVMLSKEESLTVLNYEWSDYSDRNDVIFLSREEYEDRFESEDERW